MPSLNNLKSETYRTTIEQETKMNPLPTYLISRRSQKNKKQVNQQHSRSRSTAAPMTLTRKEKIEIRKKEMGDCRHG
jgi:hypothetical protein